MTIENLRLLERAEYLETILLCAQRGARLCRSESPDRKISIMLCKVKTIKRRAQLDMPLDDWQAKFISGVEITEKEEEDEDCR